MMQINGKAVNSGVAIGPIYYIHKYNEEILKLTVSDTTHEIKKFHEAKAIAEEQIDTLYQRALSDLGAEHAAIFDVHKMLLNDTEYVNSILTILQEQKVNIEYAIEMTQNKFVALFTSMEDEYMQSRASDLIDISQRLIQILIGKSATTHALSEPSIIVADRKSVV